MPRRDRTNSGLALRRVNHPPPSVQSWQGRRSVAHGFFRGRRNLDFDVKSLVDQEDLLHLDARGNHYPHVLGLRDMTHRVIPDLSD